MINKAEAISSKFLEIYLKVHLYNKVMCMPKSYQGKLQVKLNLVLQKILMCADNRLYAAAKVLLKPPLKKI